MGISPFFAPVPISLVYSQTESTFGEHHVLVRTRQHEGSPDRAPGPISTSAASLDEIKLATAVIHRLGLVPVAEDAIGPRKVVPSFDTE